MDINSTKSDFSPVLSGNTLFFSSGRPSALVVSYANELNTEITDLYTATKKDSVSFSRLKPLSKKLNTKVNEGSLTINKTGDTIYFSGNARPGKAQQSDVNRLQIFKSGKNAEDWSTAIPVSFCDPPYSCFHPALSADNNMIVFGSDMPGGFGGIDLYYAKRENNTWSSAVNLGNKVNSAANELFPFVCGNKQLYFSSNRSGGLGGLDLYEEDLDSLSSAPYRLEPPVNSIFDDFGIFTDSIGKAGYFTSNRRASSGTTFIISV